VRILLVNWQDRTNPQAGGAEVHLHEIFGRIAAMGHEVHLACSGYRGAAAADVVDGIRVHRTASRFTFALAGRGAVRRLAADLSPDVVVEDVNKVPLGVPGLVRAPTVLLVPHLFGTTAFRELPFGVAAIVWLAERPMPRRYAGCPVQAISGSTRDDLVARGFRPEAVRVIHPGVDTAHFHPEPAVAREPEPTFLYVGRLKRYKQVEVALEALAELRRTAPGARLWIAGAGDDRPRLERVARTLGLETAAEFLGFVSEERKLDLYRRAWAVVLPSLKEGWGITNLEAAACGTPALAADNSALRESVRDGETGFLFPTSRPAALAQAMQRLASEAGLRERLGRGARAFAETFSWERTARETLAHLETVAADGPRRQET
jgi:glycosyltransferase involved in cell wall biosynthesis